jgi:hypothetical protein
MWQASTRTGSSHGKNGPKDVSWAPDETFLTIGLRLDKIAGLLRDAPDEELARRVYHENPWLTVTAKVLSFVSGTPTDVAVLPTLGV